jgi:hypothetical protein
MSRSVSIRLARLSAPRRALQFGHLVAGFHFVPEGRLKLVLGCYESGVPDRFEVKISAPRSEFRRPSGTQAMSSRTPAINRRATVICPSGT